MPDNRPCLDLGAPTVFRAHVSTKDVLHTVSFFIRWCKLTPYRQIHPIFGFGGRRRRFASTKPL